jgi:hypothetical protein
MDKTVILNHKNNKPISNLRFGFCKIRDPNSESTFRNRIHCFILSTLKRGRVGTPLMCPSVCLSVTTERLSKLRKITGKKQARFPLRPLWPPVTGSKKVTVVRGPFL